MPITSQIRLQQLTGSLQSLKAAAIPGPLKAMNDSTGASAADLEDVLKYYAQAVANIHGNTDIAAQAAGSFSQDIYSDTDRARLLGQLQVSEGSSMSDQPSAPSSIDATTTSLTYSSLSAALTSGSIIKLQKSDGTFMLFSVPSGASLGATSVGVQYVSDGSTLTSVAAADIQTVKKDVTVTASEWKGVRAPNYVSKQDMLINPLVANKKVTIEVNRSSNDGIVLKNSNAAGAIQAEVGGAVALTVHDDRLEATLTSEATSSSAVASLQVKGGAAVAKKIFAGSDIAIDSDVNKKISIGATEAARLFISHKDLGFDGLPTKIHQSGSFDLRVGGEKGVQILAAGGSGIVSGSTGVVFPTDAGFGFGGDTAGGLKLMNLHQESIDYRALTDAAGNAFGGTTSILSAFSKLNAKIAAGEPTLFKFEAGAGFNQAAVTVAKVAGDATALATSVPANKLDVFVNGQMMLEGSGKDYNVTASNVITFEFNVVEGDVVIAIDRS